MTLEQKKPAKSKVFLRDFPTEGPKYTKPQIWQLYSSSSVLPFHTHFYPSPFFFFSIACRVNKAIFLLLLLLLFRSHREGVKGRRRDGFPSILLFPFFVTPFTSKKRAARMDGWTMFGILCPVVRLMLNFPNSLYIFGGNWHWGDSASVHVPIDCLYVQTTNYAFFAVPISFPLNNF